MKAMTIKVPAQLSARIARLARRRGVNRSEMARQMLERFREDEEPTVADRISHLVGSVKGLPPDLSTNPRHLRGYGK